MDNTTNNVEKFDWIQIRKDIGPSEMPETNKEKMIRKIKENPLVPAGCLLTLGALSYGLWCFRIGDTKKSQYMMRLRVAAQGFTLFALVVGIGMTAARKQAETKV